MNFCEWKALKAIQAQDLSVCEITVCTGGSCSQRGARSILDAMVKELGVKPGRRTADGRFRLETANCLDRCSLAPSVAFDERIYSQLNVQEALGLLKSYRQA